MAAFSPILPHTLDKGPDGIVLDLVVESVYRTSAGNRVPDQSLGDLFGMRLWLDFISHLTKSV